MEVKDIKHSYSEENGNQFGIDGDRSMEEYLSEWIDNGESYTIEIDNVFKAKIEIELSSIINILIDDMYEDNPAYMTENIAQQILETNGDDDNPKIIWKVIAELTNNYIHDTLSDVVSMETNIIKESDIIWH